MVFKLTFESKSVSCSSPSCVQRHLNLGWRLVDPSQTADLLEALEEIDAEPARTLLPRSLPEDPASLGHGRRY
jgi:hypothetical protein